MLLCIFQPVIQPLLSALGLSLKGWVVQKMDPQQPLDLIALLAFRSLSQVCVVISVAVIVFVSVIVFRSCDRFCVSVIARFFCWLEKKSTSYNCNFCPFLCGTFASILDWKYFWKVCHQDWTTVLFCKYLSIYYNKIKVEHTVLHFN